MDRYCVMGNPVAHSKSPWIHQRFAELTGQPIDYRHHLVPLDGFQQAVRDFRAQGGRGCNVTVPFKFDAFAVPGVRHVVQIPNGVAVVADHFWAAKRGRDALKVEWDTSGVEKAARNRYAFAK